MLFIINIFNKTCKKNKLLTQLKMVSVMRVLVSNIQLIYIPLTSSSGREDEDVTGKINHVIETPNQTLRKNADMAYQAMSEWKRNTFTLPKGNSGKDYINEMTKLIEE